MRNFLRVTIFLVSITGLSQYKITEVKAQFDNMIYEQSRHSLGYNCVKWARTVEPRLPQLLFSQADKVAHINSQDPMLGAVVVTDESYAGHVGIVRGGQDGHVLVEEANYVSGYVTLRAVPKERILGYITFEEFEEEMDDSETQTS